MKQYRFKTNIKCEGCVAKVTPFLEKHPAIKKWAVDTASPDKILTVEAEGLQQGEVADIVNEAGFKAEQLAANDRF